MRHFVPACVAAAAVVGGCNGDETTIQQVTQVVQALFPGNFPGAAANTHYVAGDGLGWSEGGVNVNPAALRWFPSGVGNRGIVLYDGMDAGNRTWIWAHYFDGSTFSPPVALAGGNQDPTAATNLEEAVVLFLNTSQAGRDGDALIFFRRLDLVTDATNGANIRCWYSYFDRSLSTTAVSTTDADVRYGFDTTPAAVDLTSATGVNVTTIGVFSDGLHGATAFLGQFFQGFGFDMSLYRQGDPVSFAGLVFIQASSLATTTRAQVRLFDLTATNVSNTLGSTSSLPIPGSTAADFLMDYLCTYDGSVFFWHIDTPTTPDSQNLCWNVYRPSSGWNGTATVINPTDATNQQTVGVPFPGSLFGPDEGLVNLIGAIKVERTGFTTNRSVFAFQVDPATGGFNASNDRLEIDADTTNSGANPQVVTDDSIKTVLNRTGEWILVRWVQPRVAGGTARRALWVLGIQTTRSGTAPALNTRTTSGGATRLDAGSTTTDEIALDSNSDPIVKEQSGVAYGCDGYQSDRYTQHLIWQQDVTASGEDRVRTRRITFTPSTGAGNPNGFTFGTEDFIDFLDTELANTQSGASPGGWGSVQGLDGGGAGGNAGDMLLYYVRNTGSASVPVYRAFQRRQSGASWSAFEIGSLNSGVVSSSKQALWMLVAQTPGSNDLTGSPNHAGVCHHIFIGETREADTAPAVGSTAIRHRYYDKTSTDATQANRFTPKVAASTPPVTIDPDVPGDASVLFTYLGRIPIPAMGAEGQLGGVFLSHGNHCWYNEWNPTSRTWYTSGGAPAPELIDHESSAALMGALVGQPYSAAQPCSTLHKTIVFWNKLDVGSNRWYVRVRD